MHFIKHISFVITLGFVVAEARPLNFESERSATALPGSYRYIPLADMEICVGLSGREMILTSTSGTPRPNYLIEQRLENH